MPLLKDRETLAGLGYYAKSPIHPYVSAVSTSGVTMTVTEANSYIDFQGNEVSRVKINLYGLLLSGAQGISAIEVAHAATGSTSGLTGATLDATLLSRHSAEILGVTGGSPTMWSSGTTGTTYVDVLLPSKPYNATIRCRFMADGKRLLNEDGSVFEITTTHALQGAATGNPTGSFTLPQSKALARTGGVHLEWWWQPSGISPYVQSFDIWRATSASTSTTAWTFVTNVPATQSIDFKTNTGSTIFGQFFDSYPGTGDSIFYYILNPIDFWGVKRSKSQFIIDFIINSSPDQVLYSASSSITLWKRVSGGLYAVGGLSVGSGGEYIVVWRAPVACTATALWGFRVGGTGATVNARKNLVSNLLAIDLSLLTPNVWSSGGALTNATFAAGDILEILIATVDGGPTQVIVQIDFETDII